MLLKSEYIPELGKSILRMYGHISAFVGKLTLFVDGERFDVSTEGGVVLGDWERLLTPGSDVYLERR
jgi:hypothetical protein